MLWTRPSGSTIETNDSKATIAHAESQGWKRVEKKVKKRVVQKPKDEKSIN